MARRKKKKRRASEEPAEPGPPAAPDRISRPFADALRGVKVEADAEPERAAKGRRPQAPQPVRRRREPPAGRGEEPPAGDGKTERPEHQYAQYSYEDRVALSQLYAGVRPLGRRERVAARRPVEPPREARTDSGETAGDAQARARLAALVAGGIRFEVRRDEDGNVQGQRAGTDPGALRSLRGGRARPEAEVDLHGMTAEEAEREVVRFVRRSRERGARVVRIVHGKGLHSEAGLGVLGDRVLHALTDGGAAPFVLAFASTAPQHGGRGALLVRLTR